MSMTRRDALKGAVGVATLGVRPPRSGRDRVAIIGGGAGGAAAAYFLAGSLDVDLSRREPGSAATAIRA